jgi:SHS2 domain-containing protein
LLVDWLGELLYLSERAGACYDDFEIVELDSTALRARVRGSGGRAPRRGIKAVTYSDLQVLRTAAGHEVTITFDV